MPGYKDEQETDPTSEELHVVQEAGKEVNSPEMCHQTRCVQVPSVIQRREGLILPQGLRKFFLGEMILKRCWSFF